MSKGSIGYDVAQMRFAYQRLKWDSSALQRILYGDVGRSRQVLTRALGAWNLANVILRNKDLRGVFVLQELPPPKYTSFADLITMGYTLQSTDDKWSPEETR